MELIRVSEDAPGFAQRRREGRGEKAKSLMAKLWEGKNWKFAI
jgi:hypothetical protein